MILAVLLGAVAGAVWAEPYWIAYEGNEFPENDGWLHYASSPPAQRWLENGSLFIDSRADPNITDIYGMYPTSGLDPEPGETFLMTWRLNVYEAAPWEYPGVGLRSDERYAVAFIFAEDYLWSVYEPFVLVQFTPGMFHEFELRSTDMRTYELYLDGAFAVEGAFCESLFPPGLWWGDILRGGSSFGAWDYFRFGVVPEPGTLVLMFFGAAALRGKEV
ncbi:MAG: PEP-CTERM sorting domain-containing protein [Planctomycetota bacterium]